MKRPDPAKTSFLCLLAATVCLLFPGAEAAAARAGSPRDPGALYMADISARLCRLHIVGDAPAYTGANGAKLLPDKLPPGQVVELVAVSASNDLLGVRADGKPEAALAWVSRQAVTPLDPTLAAVIKTRTARRQQVRALAARSQIALNMTRQEIIDILDKPLKRTPGPAAGVETWEYPFFIGVPRQVVRSDNSRLGSAAGSTTSLVQDRIQAGTIQVSFTQGLVSAIEYRGVPGLKPGNTPPPRSVLPPVVWR